MTYKLSLNDIAKIYGVDTSKRIGGKILDQIGNTPLLKIEGLTENKDVQIYAKAEGLNPFSGSHKDRVVQYAIKDAERLGLLKKGMGIVESSSGNTAEAVAAIGKIKGYKVKIFVPENTSEYTVDNIRKYGADIVFTPALEGSDGAIRAVRKFYKNNSDEWYYLNQYDNPSNLEAHRQGTAKEIWSQIKGRVTHGIFGSGTGGHGTAITEELKKHNKNIVSIGVEPKEEMHGIEGLKRMNNSIRPKILDDTVFDRIVKVKTDEAYQMIKILEELYEDGRITVSDKGQWSYRDIEKRLTVNGRFLVGPSSGAVMHIASKVGEEIDSGVIVSMLYDSGEAYNGTDIWKRYMNNLTTR